MREMVGAGGNSRAERAAAKVKRITFREFAEQYVKDHRTGWTNAKHAT